VCQDDLIVLSEENYKKMGGIGPLLLCYKQINNLKFIDPVTFETLDLDNNTYWRYALKSYIDRKALSEFLILSCEEEIDYKKLAEKDKSKRTIKKIVRNKNNNNNEGMDIETDNKMNESKASVNTNMTNKSQYLENLEKKLEDKKIKIVNVKCIRNSGKDENKEIIETRSFLGRKMSPGDVYYGYDLTRINISEDLEGILSKKKEKIPDIILVKKKYNNYKRIFKLKHLDMDVEGEDDEEDDEKEKNTKKGKKKKKKNQKEKDKDRDMEEFMEDVGKNKDLRKNINLYKDNKAIEELNKEFKNFGLDEKDENDSDVDFKEDELIDEMDNLKLDNKKNQDINSNENEADAIGKRERDGKAIKEE
jgi:hypothetical protein